MTRVPFSTEWWWSVTKRLGDVQAPTKQHGRPAEDITTEPDTCAILGRVEEITGITVHQIMHTRRRKGPQWHARRIAILAAWKRFDNLRAVAEFFERSHCTLWNTIDTATAEEHQAADRVIEALKIERLAA